jgi:Ca2+-transporting ATPase
MVERQSDFAWHAMAAEETLRRFNTSAEGLRDPEAQDRLSQVGPNALEAGEGIHPAMLLIRQVHNPLIYLLIGAAVVSLLGGHYVDAGVIAGVVVLNSVLGFVQEWRAEGALAALRKMSAPQARIRRDGQPRQIEASAVVPGDVLVLETGDRVAADARVLSSEDLHIDESALTGESQAVAKSHGPVEESAPVADRRNMVWMSTGVTGGRGRAVVVETGMRTQIGRIAHEVRSTEREQTPLQRRMARLGTILGIGGVGMAVIVFFLGLARGYETVEMLLFSVAVAVSAIPEGLPAVISVVLALGVQRMAKRHAIIRRLPAVETLGSTTVICSDKTGTITENQMTVRHIWAGGRTFEVTGEGYDPKGQIKHGQSDRSSEALQRLLRIGAVASNARLRQADGRWQADGNPSEAGLFVVARKAGLDPDKLRKEMPRIAELPFSSDRKYMATLNRTEEGAGRVLYVKGAPDRILPYCSHVLIEDKPVELTEERRREIVQANEEMASHALRVLAGAYREVGADAGLEQVKPDDVQKGLTLAGLWGLIDPPREESAQAVAEAKGAGIRPIMITGDHATTAVAIARHVGITEGNEALTGPDVDRLDKAELAQAALSTGVFARVSPANKLKILEALKAKGHIVAMTGDGVNDAPALKGADIGIAMGRAGTEVAKEAADMVLTDDNFATIVHAIEEGRVIYSNLRRVVFFLLATNLGEVLTLVGALLVGLPLPLTAIMVLWVNLVTDGVATIPLGVEPLHSDVLKMPPRDPRAPVLDRTVLLRMGILTPIMAIGTLLLFWYEIRSGTHAHAQSIAFTTLAAFQWFQAFNARSQHQSVFTIGLFTNRWLLVGIAAAVVLQILVIHTAFGQMVFGTVPLTGIDWLLVVLVSSTIWIADETLKRLGVYGKPKARTE